MAGLTGLMQGGLSGIRTAGNALQTTGNNISNVNTAGYSRQTVDQSTATPERLGMSYLGTGTQTDAVRRSYSEYLQRQVWDARAAAGAASARNAQIEPLNNLLGDPDLTLDKAINDFFVSVQTAASTPSDIPARQALLTRAETLSARFNVLAERMQAMDRGVQTELGQRVTTVNGLLEGIANTNKAIFDLGPDVQANDLMDRRDLLISQLSDEVGVQVTLDDNGMANVFSRSGSPLVLGQKADALQLVPDTFGNGALTLATSNGRAIRVEGGAVGGLLGAQRDTLQEARDRLGQLAQAVAIAMNGQQAKGLNLDGALGADLFAAPGVRISPAGANTGTATLSAAISDVGQLAPARYQLQFDGAAWSAIRESDGQPVSVGTPSAGVLTLPGLTLNVAGAPAAGDRFLVDPVRQAANEIRVALTDPRGISGAAPYTSNAATSNTGQASLSTGQATVTPSAGALVLPASAFGDTLGMTVVGGNLEVRDSAGTLLGSQAYSAAGTTLSLAYPNGAGQWEVTLAGAVAVGDQFSLAPAGGQDNRNLVAMGTWQQQGLLDQGQTALTQSYSALVNKAGADGAEARLADVAQTALVSQSQGARDSLAGVNLDEEAANLMRFQQAYQASAKVLQTADILFKSILELG